MADLGKVMITPRGRYVTGVAYKVLDIVSHNGSSYLAIKDTAIEPADDGINWMLIAQKGDTGEQGIQGGKGDTAYPDEIPAEDIWALYGGDIDIDVGNVSIGISTAEIDEMYDNDVSYEDIGISMK